MKGYFLFFFRTFSRRLFLSPHTSTSVVVERSQKFCFPFLVEPHTYRRLRTLGLLNNFLHAFTFVLVVPRLEIYSYHCYYYCYYIIHFTSRRVSALLIYHLQLDQETECGPQVIIIQFYIIWRNAMTRNKNNNRFTSNPITHEFLSVSYGFLLVDCIIVSLLHEFCQFKYKTDVSHGH